MSDRAAAAPAVAGAAKPPLDDIMLAMDVVDTLRRRRQLVERELDETGREEDFKARLKRIYAQQGIAVPDHVIEQGVAALKEDRFTYVPPPGGLGRRLALIYVSRGRWGKWLAGAVAALVLAAAAWYFAVVAPRQALPNELAAAHQQALALTRSDAARATVQELYEDGQAALRGDDRDAARAALEQLQQARRTLDLEYVVRVVNGPGQPSGVWRIPDVNRQARNYYLLVEAIAGDRGRGLTLPIENEETGETESVDTWGVRVDEDTFDAVRRDKQDDGIIQNDRVGAKQRGFLAPRYEIRTTGGAITRW
jgi:hypothetical protein